MGGRYCPAHLLARQTRRKKPDEKKPPEGGFFRWEEITSSLAQRQQVPQKLQELQQQQVPQKLQEQQVLQLQLEQP
ncbi:MAG: hypothetical protein RIR09_2011 [Pseudomonadota bacterium]